jgi:hypothetical protein
MDTNHSLECAILSKLNPWLRLESDSNPIPRIFTHIDDYKSAFEPKLLEEVREGVKTTLNHAIGMSNDVPNNTTIFICILHVQKTSCFTK